MAVTYAGRSTSTATGGFRNGTGVVSLTQSVAYPSGIVAGDLLVMTLYGEGRDTNSDYSFTSPGAGWIKVRDVVGAVHATGTNLPAGVSASQVWVRVATGTESGGVSITGGASYAALTYPTGGGRTQWWGEILRFTGLAGHRLVSLGTAIAENITTVPHQVNLPTGTSLPDGLHLALGHTSVPGISKSSGLGGVGFTDVTLPSTAVFGAEFLFASDLATFSPISTSEYVQFAASHAQLFEFVIGKPSGGPWLGLRRG